MEQRQGLKRRQENQGLVGNTYSPEVYQTKKETAVARFSLSPLFVPFDLSKIMAP